MENRTPTKNFPVGDKIYQLNKVTPRTGCWLFSFLAARQSDSSVLSGLGRCTRAEFDEIQTIALRQVFLLDIVDGNTLPIAVLAPDGNLIGDLKDDTELTFKLTTASLLFSLDAFLVVVGSSSQSPNQ